MSIPARLYRFKRILKFLFPTFVVILSCILLSGPVALLTLMGVSSSGFYQMIGLNTSDLFNINNQTWANDKPPTYSEIVSMIGGNVKAVMCSGIALFLYVIGAMGLLFWELWTRTNNKHHEQLWMIGAVLFFTSVLGVQVLFNFAYS